MEHDLQFYRENVLTPLKDCRDDFTENVGTAYEDRSIDDFLKGMCQQHGYDTVATLLSERIKDGLWDGRYSRDVKSWAENYQTSMPVSGIPEDVLRRTATFNTHPVIINVCAGTLIQIEKEIQESSKAEPSLTENKSAAEQLYDKMSAEQDGFRDFLLSLPPSEILNHTYEYTVRQDILFVVESGDLTEDEAKALLKSDSPLSDIYDRFDKKDISYMDDIRETFSEVAKKISEKESDIPTKD